MVTRRRMTVDGNEAAASVAYRASETIAIYPDHAEQPDGRALRRVGEPKESEPVGSNPRSGRNAVGRRRGRRRPRRAAGRLARDHLHGLAGPAPDDPQHVQDRGRAHALHDARGGAHARHARVVDLRRSLRRHGLPPDRLRAALRELRAGSARHGRRRARRDARDAHPLPALLRRLPDVTRGGENRRAQRRRPAHADRGIVDLRASSPRADARSSGAPRHRPEPRRVLSGAGSRESLLRRVPGDRRTHDASRSPN